MVDISDENRPTKLAERYNELYDNDWTDAFDTLTDSGQTDEMAIKKLKNVLMVVSIYMYFYSNVTLLQAKRYFRKNVICAGSLIALF